MDTIPKTEADCRLQSQLDPTQITALAGPARPPTKLRRAPEARGRDPRNRARTQNLDRRPSEDKRYGERMSGPNFLLPYVNDPDKAEKAWRGMKAFMEDRHGWPAVTDWRIFRLEYSDKGRGRELARSESLTATGHPRHVGLERDRRTRGRRVCVAIFEDRGGPYLVCTHNRGVVHGEHDPHRNRRASDCHLLRGVRPERRYAIRK